jgi:type I restriction enzyme S subunit
LIHKAVTRGLNDKVKLKDSGVEWIGKIPEHWEVKKVTHLFEKIGSGTTPTSGDNRYFDGDYNFLQTGDLNDGKINQTNRTLKEKAFRDFSSLKIYPKGSLVMAMYGATIGKLGILEIESATNQACCVFGKPKNILIEYFFQVLLAFRMEIISFGYGGGQPNISQDLIKSLRFPIPSKKEQTEIAEFIETATAKIATAISLKEQEIEKLKEYKMSLIDGVVSGKVKVC